MVPKHNKQYELNGVTDLKAKYKIYCDDETVIDIDKCDNELTRIYNHKNYDKYMTANICKYMVS